MPKSACVIVAPRQSSPPAATAKMTILTVAAFPSRLSRYIWATDISYIPMARGFVYLTAVMDWFTPRILAWTVEHDGGFVLHRCCRGSPCKTRLPANLRHRSGQPVHSTEFTSVLINNAISISMDGKGAWRDNVFVERFWRTIKYEEVYLRAYDGVEEARYAATSPSTTLHQNTHLSMPLKERGFAGRGLILWGIGPCDARVQRGL